MSYLPQVDDYVKWKPHIEGWVYFFDHEYITIEISVADKPDDLVYFHKKTHCCVVCPYSCWNELKYIKNRRSEQK